ncbi:MAG: efflux RND transporter periplasmic adaptor subunit [Rhizobacter sp.]|nr:efflux RND transporter periplasmic adaptor subunit [Rhizobacter sp.]
MNRKLWTTLGVAVLAAAGAAAWWYWRDGDTRVSYRTARIERGLLLAAVSASGTVTPVTQVQVSSQVSGQIKELFVDFNSEVKQDQLIARLDPESFEYRLRQANADVEAARASVLTAQANVLQATAQLGRAQVDLQEAQRDLERKQDLVAKDFISPAEADRVRALTRTLAESQKAAQAQVAVAQAQAQSAQAIVKQREAQLAQARVDLDRTQIRSPVNGIIIKRSVEVGQTVAASLQAPELFVIAANLNDMQVETSIDEADISRVRPAQKVGFTIDAFPGRSFEGSVKQVRKAAVTAQNVTTYTVVVAFANPGSNLLPGMTANVRIVTETRDNVLKVPNAALRVRIAGVEPAASGAAASAPRSGDAARWSWLPTAQAQPAGGAGSAAGPAAATAPAAASAGGGPLREFRDRLVAELGLDAAQTQKVDALFAEARPRFGELRNLPEEARAKARERILAELRARVAEQLTPEQRPKYQALLSEIGGRQTSRGRIYLLGGDGKPAAYAVRLGISDGVATELIVPPGSPGADVLVEGATVITGVLSGAPAAQRPAGPRLPF